MIKELVTLSKNSLIKSFQKTLEINLALLTQDALEQSNSRLLQSQDNIIPQCQVETSQTKTSLNARTLFQDDKNHKRLRIISVCR